MARWSPAQSQRQLQRDIAAGRPIYYRRKPGAGRVYFNPDTGQEVSENYVIRVYRPALQAQERQRVVEQANKQRGRLSRYRSSLRRTYIPTEGGVEFQAAYEQLRSVSYAARYSSGAARQDAYAPDGAYAQALVALGRRLPTDDFPVGQSPQGHINNTVLPALRGG